MRPTAAKADLRPFQINARSVGSVASRCSMAAGTMPAAMSADVEAPAWSVDSKPTRIVRTSSGSRTSGPGDVEVDDPGLDHRPLVCPADLGDGTHAGGHDEHALGVRERPAGQTRAGTPGDLGDRFLGTRADDGGELRRVLRYDD